MENIPSESFERAQRARLREFIEFQFILIRIRTADLGFEPRTYDMLWKNMNQIAVDLNDLHVTWGGR